MPIGSYSREELCMALAIQNERIAIVERALKKDAYISTDWFKTIFNIEEEKEEVDV